MERTDTTTSSLEIWRTLAAPVERIYDAWTTPDALARWFAPSGDYTTVVHAMDLSVGGRYRIEMRHRSGAAHIAVGNYRELSRPTRLAFTWRWEGTAMEETVVTVALTPADDQRTELVLTHSGFANDKERDEHAKGWNGCLERIGGGAPAAA